MVEEERLKIWEILFQRALVLIDEARSVGIPVDDWTFGGGTVLMRRHRHRFSKDVDIFINDPQFVSYLSPRLSPAAESLTADYVEAREYLKLVFPEGEIDFIGSAPLTGAPAVTEELFGRPFLVETSTEIVAKKVWHRGEQFTARDIFDLAMVSEREPGALTEIVPILRDRSEAILSRMEKSETSLRESFGSLETLDYQRTFDECVAIVRTLLHQ
jgi:predicted nucleotidyltransferase component of viral defense system